MRGFIIATGALVFLTHGVHAEPPRPPPVPSPAHANAIEIGPWIVFAFLGGYDGTAIGGRVAGGIVRDRLYLGVEAAAAKLSLTQLDQDSIAGIHGTIVRTGINLRWTWGRIGITPGFGLEGWLSGGIGAKWIGWNQGGRMTRADAQLGAGFAEVLGPGGRFRLEAGVVVAFSRGGSGGVPRCAGPCDEPTAPVRGDHEIVDHVALVAWW